MSFESLISQLVSIIALLISIIALYYTVKAYLLKSGQRIRCDFTITSTVDCDDKYISNLTLENLKDRSSVIFSIYLQLGAGNYLLLEDFENEPLILKPFEAYYKKFDPIQFYSVNLKRVKIDSLLKDSKVKKRIILSTTDGRYIVKATTKKWNPLYSYFDNYYTAIISPKRFYYKRKSYGNNIEYIVELTYDDNKSSILPFKSGDDKLKLFDDFQLTEASLKSSKQLEKFFRKLNEKGILQFKYINVIDVKTESMKLNYENRNNPIEVPKNGFFEYEILGLIYTKYENWKLNRKNKSLRK